MRKMYIIPVLLFGLTQGLNAQSLCLDCDTSRFINSNLEACFPFNGNALDESGNGNNGSIMGPGMTYDRKGRSDSAFSFDGSSDYISVNNLFDYTSRTYSLWFRVSSATSVQNVIVSDDPGLTNGLTAIGVENTGNLQVVYVVGSVATFRTDIAYHVWYHAAIVVNNTGVTYYLNGKSVYSGTNNKFKSGNGSGKTIVGGSRDISTYWFNGSIDDVRIYSTALNSGQVDSLYRNNCYTCDSIFISNDSLEACFPFNGDVIDESGNNNDGVIMSSVLANDRYAKVQSAYQFDGNADYIRVPNLFDYDSRTYSVWFRSDDATVVENILVSDDPAQDKGLTAIGVRTNAGKKVVSFSVGSGATKYYSINTGVWYHAAIVVDGNQARYYLNGMDMSGPLTNNYFSSSNGSGSTIIGGSRDTSTYWFEGAIDDIKIYSRALSHKEIMNLSRDTSCKNEFRCSPDTTGPNALMPLVPNQLVLYPNPGNGFVRIELPRSGEMNQLRVYSMDGKLCLINDLSGTNEATFDLTGLTKGLYIIQVTDQNNQQYRAKYVKQ